MGICESNEKTKGDIIINYTTKMEKNDNKNTKRHSVSLVFDGFHS